MRITDTAEKLFYNMKQGCEIGDMDKKIIGGLGFSKNEHIPYSADPSIISPLFEINDDKADILGEYIFSQKAGFAVKEFEDWTSVYIGAPYVQADVIRAIAKKYNAHLFSQNKQAIIYANESFLGIHASWDGAVEIDLKREWRS